MDNQMVETRAGRLSRSESAAWGGSLVVGILWVVIGVMCLVATGAASLAAVYYVGVLLTVAGLVGIGTGFSGAGAGALIMGVLSAVVGVMMFIHPGSGLAALTLLVIAYFWIAGLFRIVTSLADRYDGRGFDFASGVSALIIGVVGARSWPISAFWLLGVLVGAELVTRGIFVIAAAVSARHVLRQVRTAP